MRWMHIAPAACLVSRTVVLWQVTPYLLDRIRVLTGGKSLEANIKLVKHNASVGAAIAVEHARLPLAQKPAAHSRL